MSGMCPLACLVTGSRRGRLIFVSLYLQEAVRTESSWYSMIEMPKQNRAEPVQDYILRVCTVIESLRVPLDANKEFRETQKEKEQRIEKVNGNKLARGFGI